MFNLLRKERRVRLHDGYIMGYYGDCRDCQHRGSIHKSTYDEDVFVCDYSKKRFYDVYGEQCRCFLDADEVEKKEDEQRRKEQAYKSVIYAGLFADCFDDIIDGLIWLIHWFLVGYFFYWLLGSNADAAIVGKVAVVLYVLYCAWKKFYSKDREKISYLKAWLFIIGICILHALGLVGFVIYLAVIGISYYVYKRTRLTVVQIAVIVLFIGSCIMGLGEYERKVNAKLYDALSEAIYTQDKYWEQKDNGEKYLAIRFVLPKEYPDKLSSVLPTRKGTKHVIFRILDYHYSLPYANYQFNLRNKLPISNNPAENLRFDFYLFDNTVGIVSENTPSEIRKPYEALGQRFDYEEYKAMVEKGKKK